MVPTTASLAGQRWEIPAPLSTLSEWLANLSSNMKVDFCQEDVDVVQVGRRAD